MNRPSKHVISFGLAAILTLAGLALMLIPAPAHSLPPFAPFEESQDAAPPSAAVIDGRYRLLFDLFDLSALPEPVAPPTVEIEAPPPDPAAALKRYRYLGGASAGERSAALFEADGTVATLRLGDTLAGFTLISFNAEAATFRKDDLEASLLLVQP